MGRWGSIPHSQGFSNDPYPQLTQPKYSHWNILKDLCCKILLIFVITQTNLLCYLLSILANLFLIEFVYITLFSSEIFHQLNCKCLETFRTHLAQGFITGIFRLWDDWGRLSEMECFVQFYMFVIWELRSSALEGLVVIFFLSPTLPTQGVRNSVVEWQHKNQKMKEHQ